MDEVQRAPLKKEKKRKSKKEKRRRKEEKRVKPTQAKPSLTEVALAMRQMTSFVRATLDGMSAVITAEVSHVAKLSVSARSNIAYWEELTKKRECLNLTSCISM